MADRGQRDAASGTTPGRLAQADCRRKQSRNKPRIGSVSLGATCERAESGGVRSASPGPIGAGATPANGRYEQIRDHRGARLHGVACRRAGDEVERSSAIIDPKRRNGIGANLDNRRVLHRGNDGELLQRRHWSEYRRLWRKKRFRIDQRIDQWIEHPPGSRHIVDSAMPCRAAIQRIVQLIESGRTGVERRPQSRNRADGMGRLPDRVLRHLRL